MTSNEHSPIAASQPSAGQPLERAAFVDLDSESNSGGPRRRRYSPGHPWYYLPNGDNLSPLPVEQILPGSTGDTVARELPKEATKREHRLRELLALEEAELQRSADRYRDLAARGADALSDYDRNIAYSGNLELARASSLALVHNHICWHKGRLAYIRAELDAYGPLLF